MEKYGLNNYMLINKTMWAELNRKKKNKFQYQEIASQVKHQLLIYIYSVSWYQNIIWIITNYSDS